MKKICRIIAVVLAISTLLSTVAYSSSLSNQKTVDIKNGRYYIHTYDKKYYIDVKSKSKNSGANIHIWERAVNPPDSQVFKIIKDGQYYYIQNENSGLVIDVSGAGTADKTNIQQWELNKSNAQKWQFLDAGNGMVYIKSALGKMMDIQSGDFKDGTNVWLYSFNESNAQKFLLIPIDGSCDHSCGYTTIVRSDMSCVAVCKNCNSEFKLPSIDTSVRGTYKTNTDNLGFGYYPYKESVAKRMEKGSYVNIVGKVNNAYGNTWFKTADGLWVYHSYVDKVSSELNFCDHSAGYKTTKKANGEYVAVCKSCNTEYVISKIDSSFEGKYDINKDVIVLNSAPYQESTTEKKVYYEDVIEVVGGVYNAYHNLWYKLSDGCFIYSGHANKHIHRLKSITSEEKTYVATDIDFHIKTVLQGGTCVCGYIMPSKQANAEEQHTFVDGICIYCGYRRELNVVTGNKNYRVLSAIPLYSDSKPSAKQVGVLQADSIITITEEKDILGEHWAKTIDGHWGIMYYADASTKPTYFIGTPISGNIDSSLMIPQRLGTYQAIKDINAYKSVSLDSTILRQYKKNEKLGIKEIYYNEKGVVIGLTINNEYINLKDLNYLDEPNIVFNGKNLSIEHPVIVTDKQRTIVPIRDIAEAMGATVSWDNRYNLAVVTIGLQTEVFQIGSKTVFSNNVTKIDEEATIVRVGDENKTYVPIRVISEHFGAKVDWNNGTKTITITYNPPGDSAVINDFKANYFWHWNNYVGFIQKSANVSSAFITVLSNISTFYSDLLKTGVKYYVSSKGISKKFLNDVLPSYDQDMYERNIKAIIANVEDVTEENAYILPTDYRLSKESLSTIKEGVSIAKGAISALDFGSKKTKIDEDIDKYDIAYSVLKYGRLGDSLIEYWLTSYALSDAYLYIMEDALSDAFGANYDGKEAIVYISVSVRRKPPKKVHQKSPI